MGRLFCSSCGGSVDEGASFCIQCGHRIAKPVAKVNDSDRKEAREQISRAVSLRERADKRISPLWIIVPLILLTVAGLATTVIVVTEMLDIFSDWDPDEELPDFEDIYSGQDIIVLQLVSLMAYGIIGKLSYDLIIRLERHFEREKPIRDAMMRFAERTTGGRYHYRLPRGAEPKRMPLLWPIFIITPPLMSLLGMYALVTFDDWSRYVRMSILTGLVQLLCYIAAIYMLHFIGQDTIGHHSRWCGFTMETKVELARMGYAAGHLRTPESLPDRSSVVYIVVTIFTFGLFAFYWFYVLIKDANEHFEAQMQFEDGLLELLDRPPGSEPHERRFTPRA